MELKKRLERLGKKKLLTKAEVYKYLEVSRSMVSAMLKGTRNVGVKFEHRLLQAEREAGIDVHEEEVLAAVGRSATVSREAGAPHVLKEVMREELHGLSEARDWRSRALEAERQAAELRQGLAKIGDSVGELLAPRRKAPTNYSSSKPPSLAEGMIPSAVEDDPPPRPRSPGAKH